MFCVFGDYQWVDYNLSRDWDTLTVTVGLSDVSSDRAQYGYKIYVDGLLEEEGTVRLKQAKRLVIPVKNALRLRLHWDGITCGKAGRQDAFVWGHPELS